MAYPVLDGIAAAVPRLDEGCILDRDGRDSHCGGMMLLDGRQVKMESASKELLLKYGVAAGDKKIQPPRKKWEHAI